jgi:hypothetical protein
MSQATSYSGRFEFGRLFIDAGRVLVRGWLPILAALLAFGALPALLISTPWVRAPPGTAPEAFEHVRGQVELAKMVINLIANIATGVCTVLVALKVLTDGAWPDVLRPRSILAGCLTALCLDLVVNAAVLAPPAIAALAPVELDLQLIGWLSWFAAFGPPILVIATSPFAGVAVTTAVAEGALPPLAFARSFVLLRGLRWRMVGLCLAELLALALAQYVVGISLALAGEPYFGFGPGRLAVVMSPLAVGAATHGAFVSFYLQARRSAEGPTAKELHDVFA